jgi:hypothetical protein
MEASLQITKEKQMETITKTPLELISDTDRYTLSAQELATVLGINKSTVVNNVKKTGQAFDGLPVIYIHTMMRFSLPLIRAALGYQLPKKPEPKQLPVNSQPLVDLANYVAEVADAMSTSQIKWVNDSRKNQMIWINK